jgi:hypothetical protein
MEEKKRVRSNSRSDNSGKHKKAAYIEEPIILNYGIEIEAVFELIHEYNAYNQFIKFYLNNINNNDKINSTMRNFIKILKIFIDNTDNDDEQQTNFKQQIKMNKIYLELTKIYKRKQIIEKKITKSIEKEKDEYDFLSGLGDQDVIESEKEEIEIEVDNIDNFLNTNLINLIDEAKKPINIHNQEISINIKKFINDWYNFLNIAIIIIKYKLDKSLISIKDKNEIFSLLNIPSPEENNIFNNFKNIFNLNDSIKLYNYINDDINDFYKAQIKDDEILLLLTEDKSVICANYKVYKDIKSGEIIKYNYLLNKCEFITQPFKNINEINTKLSIFFNEPIINKTLLNCIKTSQHVHISFNNSTGIIKPDIYLILTIVCICHYFQDEIFSLFLRTRTNNEYCKKLNFNNTLEDIHYFINNNPHFYNNHIIKILMAFYEKHENLSDYYFNRYYWFNILNLYKLTDNSPYTIEFRLKQGSTDVIELGNVCKLYENIINYAFSLLNNNNYIRDITDIRLFKNNIEILITNKTTIFNQIILNNINNYFTDPNSEYVKGLNKLNLELSEPTQGGKLKSRKSIKSIKSRKSIKSIKIINGRKNIQYFINNLTTKPIYKMNSFGKQFIGYGLNDIITKNLETKFNSGTITENVLKQYLKLNNIFYDI